MKFRKIIAFLLLSVGATSLTLFSSLKEKEAKTNNEDILVLKRERNNLITYADNDTSLSIIVIVAVVGITITGAYIYLMKGNDKK